MSDKSNKGNPSNERPLAIKAAPPAAELPLAENQPKQPRNLQGLLKFSMEATKMEDAPNPSNFQPLDEENKKFLSKAIDSLTVNVIEELQKCIKILSDVTEVKAEDDPTKHEDALECMSDYVDNMDIANDFYKIGGFAVFGPCLNSPHASIRSKVAHLMAELAQNNPYCQDKILEMGLMPILLEMIDSDPSEQTRIKALYAVSCIVRGNMLALKYMDINDGYSILIRAMQTPVEKLQVKSAFLLSSLCSRDNSDALKSTLIKMGLIEQAAALLSSSTLHSDTRDALLAILNHLTADSNLPALRECRRPELCLQDTLLRCVKDLQAEQAIDEIQFCTNLLDKIFADQSVEHDR